MRQVTGILISDSFQHARATAEVDWDWARMAGTGLYRSPDGHIVRLIMESHHLAQFPRGTKLFYGYGWQNMPERDRAVISELLKAGILEPVMIPALGQHAKAHEDPQLKSHY